MSRYSGMWYDSTIQDCHEAQFLDSDQIEEEFEETYGHAPDDDEFDLYIEARELEYIS